MGSGGRPQHTTATLHAEGWLGTKAYTVIFDFSGSQIFSCIKSLGGVENKVCTYVRTYIYLCHLAWVDQKCRHTLYIV